MLLGSIIASTVQTPNPVHIGSITDGTEGKIIDGNGGAKLLGLASVYVSGNYAYVTSENSNALEIVYIINPADPVPIHFTS